MDSKEGIAHHFVLSFFDFLLLSCCPCVHETGISSLFLAFPLCRCPRHRD